jgi:ectoine hydroxylase-related dioxygenase (phytanoyl-CoA dioxygenase family)
MGPLTQEQLAVYNEEGYVILRQEVSRKHIDAMLAAFERLMDRALAGECEIGWIDKTQRVPARTGSLLSSSRYDDAYAQWMDGGLADQLDSVLGGPGRHSLFGMLNSGGGQAYKQGWHRDLGKPGAPDEVEFLRLHHGKCVQFNAPLLEDDHYLNIVPFSHLRASTQEEMDASAAGEKANMPEAMVVELSAGDIVYYNANLWHRGWNPEGNLRWTMHCAFWLADREVMKHEHGQKEDILTPSHLERMPARTREYMQRYLDAYPEGEPKSLLDV